MSHSFNRTRAVPCLHSRRDIGEERRKSFSFLDFVHRPLELNSSPFLFFFSCLQDEHVWRFHTYALLCPPFLVIMDTMLILSDSILSEISFSSDAAEVTFAAYRKRRSGFFQIPKPKPRIHNVHLDSKGERWRNFERIHQAVFSGWKMEDGWSSYQQGEIRDRIGIKNLERVTRIYLVIGVNDLR